MDWYGKIPTHLVSGMLGLEGNHCFSYLEFMSTGTKVVVKKEEAHLRNVKRRNE
jgi:hypothetical protein